MLINWHLLLNHLFTYGPVSEITSWYLHRSWLWVFEELIQLK